MIAVEIKDLEFKWDAESESILKIDRLQIQQGSSLFLQGPSGSGKSTLLSLLSGILVPQYGIIKILGRSINEMSGQERDRFRADHIGYIFQMFNLLPYLSVIENVTLPCSFSKHRHNKIGSSSSDVSNEAVRLLNKLGFNSENMLNKPVTELSLGQQQRVAACRSLMGGPEILIADEPTSALDADTQGDFLSLIAEECQKNNTTLIFVSHDERLSSQFDTVARLKNKTLQMDLNTGTQL